MIKIYDKITSKDLFTEDEEQNEYFSNNIYYTALNFLFSLMEKLSHFQLKLIMCFNSVGHHFIHSRNHHLSTCKLSTSVQIQTLKGFFLPFLPFPQSQCELSLDCQLRDTAMFCLCYLPKGTEMLHQVGNQILTLTQSHCAPASAETASSFHMSRQRLCPPRTYTLPPSKRTLWSTGSITAALADSKRTICSPAPAAEETQLPVCKRQVCSGPRAGAGALVAQRKQPSAVLRVIKSGNSQWNVSVHGAEFMKASQF